jgi:hypothetical protein
MATQIANWTCSICFDNFSSTSDKPCTIPRNTNSDYLVCATCLRAQFQSAQDNEIDYPVKWQTQVLHPRQFPSAFDRLFVRTYEAREKEYKTPALQRVYCECGTFVAPMVDANIRSSWLTLASSKLCPACEARWCLRCAQRCGGFGVPHDCVPEKRLSERRLALGGLKKGRDFQVCPGNGCARTIELAEACNAITCQCGTNFCYVCGAEAEPASEHWLRESGGCPRFGVVGGGREMFDDDFGHGGNEDNVGGDDVDNEPLRIWERGEGEPTTFDFTRWAWQAAVAENWVFIRQLNAMFNDNENGAQSVDEVHRTMEMYYSVSHSGVSAEQWQELVEQHKDAVPEYLTNL